MSFIYLEWPRSIWSRRKETKNIRDDKAKSKAKSS